MFVPLRSKREVGDGVRNVLAQIEGAELDLRLHSKMLRAEMRVDDVAVVVEANVAPGCASIPVSTGALARSAGQPAQVVRIMNPPVALSHKLAAWNERRLLRDLYDSTFLATHAGVTPDFEVLDARLSNIESRLPGMKGRKNMTRAELAAALDEAVATLSDTAVQQELSGVLPADELAGLALCIRVAITRLTERLAEE